MVVRLLECRDGLVKSALINIILELNIKQHKQKYLPFLSHIRPSLITWSVFSIACELATLISLGLLYEELGKIQDKFQDHVTACSRNHVHPN